MALGGFGGVLLLGCTLLFPLIGGGFGLTFRNGGFALLGSLGLFVFVVAIIARGDEAVRFRFRLRFYFRLGNHCGLCAIRDSVTVTISCGSFCAVSDTIAITVSGYLVRNGVLWCFWFSVTILISGNGVRADRAIPVRLSVAVFVSGLCHGLERILGRRLFDDCWLRNDRLRSFVLLVVFLVVIFSDRHGVRTAGASLVRFSVPVRVSGFGCGLERIFGRRLFDDCWLRNDRLRGAIFLVVAVGDWLRNRRAWFAVFVQTWQFRIGIAFLWHDYKLRGLYLMGGRCIGRESFVFLAHLGD